MNSLLLNTVAIAVLASNSMYAQASEVENFDISSFDNPEVNIQYAGNTAIQDVKKSKSLFSLKKFNGVEENSIDVILKEKKSGIYENLTEKGEMMTLTFQDKNVNALGKIKSDFKNSGKYSEATWLEFKSAYQYEMDHRVTSSHSKHVSEHIDFNFINTKMQGDDLAIGLALKSELSEEDHHIMRVFTFFHEQAHSHENNEKTWDFLEQLTKMESDPEFKDTISGFMDYYSELETADESYSDSFALLATVKYLQEKHIDQRVVEKMKILSENITQYRTKPLENLKEGETLKHFTLPVVKTSLNYIDNNINAIKNMTLDDVKNVSKFITTQTLNNESNIHPMNSKKGMLYYIPLMKSDKADDFIERLSGGINLEIVKSSKNFSELNPAKKQDVSKDYTNHLLRKSTI
jgi:hypothetical protein